MGWLDRLLVREAGALHDQPPDVDGAVAALHQFMRESAAAEDFEAKAQVAADRSNAAALSRLMPRHCKQEPRSDIDPLEPLVGTTPPDEP